MLTLVPSTSAFCYNPAKNLFLFTLTRLCAGMATCAFN